jgi:hypothetical protein
MPNRASDLSNNQPGLPTEWEISKMKAETELATVRATLEKEKLLSRDRCISHVATSTGW